MQLPHAVLRHFVHIPTRFPFLLLPLTSPHVPSLSLFSHSIASLINMIASIIHLSKQNKQIISSSSPSTSSHPPPHPHHPQNPHHFPLSPHRHPHHPTRTIPPLPFPNDRVRQSPSTRGSWIMHWVLFEEGLAISGQFRDRVLRKIDFLEILQGIERSQRLQFFDVVCSEDQLRQLRKFGDPGDGGIVQPS